MPCLLFVPLITYKLSNFFIKNKNIHYAGMPYKILLHNK